MLQASSIITNLYFFIIFLNLFVIKFNVRLQLKALVLLLMVRFFLHQWNFSLSMSTNTGLAFSYKITVAGK